MLSSWTRLGWLSLPAAVFATTAECGGGEDPIPDQPYTLATDVEVSIDDWGVPHVYGKTLPDVAFAQGYLTAKDRLWQMDYLRRQANGELAQILGEGYYNSDVTVRTFGFARYAREAYDQLEATNPEAISVLWAYASGVNAWLDEVKAGQGTLPPQIEAIGYTPEPWHPLDSLAIDKTLAFGSSAAHSEELVVWLTSKLLGWDTTLDLLHPRTPGNQAIVPGFYDTVPTLPRQASTARPGTGPDPGLTREQLLAAIEQIKSSFKTFDSFAGSNNWVISGEYTRSGHPILANDTHEGVEAPPTYYQIHLNTLDQGGDFEVMGYGFAGMPLILLGNNDRAAWGLTLNLADVGDVYLEQRVGDAVRHNGDLVDIETREETVLVRAAGGAVEAAEARTFVVETVPHHGPILPPSMIGDVPATLTASWTGYNGASFLPLTLQMGRISTYEDLQEMVHGLVAGAVNIVYADVDGNIGYTARADIPIRQLLDPENPPYMVMPGTGEYDWSPEILPDHLIPWAYNPERGFVVTANNEPAGLNYDNDALNGPVLEETGEVVYLGTIYDVGMRADQITENIQHAQSSRDITLEDNMRWQADISSRLAERLLVHLFNAQDRSPELITRPEVAEALTWLRAFAADNYRCTVESVGCLVFHAWVPYMLTDMLADETDPALFEVIDGTYLNMWSRPVVYFLDTTAAQIDSLDFQASGGCTTDPTHPACALVFPSYTGHNYFDDVSTTDVVETRDQILLGALGPAVDVLLERGGGRLDGQSWGDVHTIHFWDPASSWGYYDANIGPFAEDGGMFTVDVADGRLSSGGEFVTNVDVGTGPSQRTLFELDPAGIRVLDVLPGGQSERPGAPHHADQLEMYLNNQYRERPFSAQDVAEAEASHVTLPAGFPSIPALLP